jgi:hypothetical protein
VEDISQRMFDPTRWWKAAESGLRFYAAAWVPWVLEQFSWDGHGITGWWFGTMEFYDFPYIGKNHPN